MNPLPSLHPLRLVVVFQPIVAMDGRKVVAAEALVRGVYGEQALGAAEVLARARAIPKGIVTLTGQVLRLACMAAAGSPESLAVHVNLDADVLLDHSELVASLVAQALEESGLSADRLSLELTEHPDDEEAIGAALRPLQALGVGLALDDIGAGAADWHRLANLPADTVKVDRQVLVNAMATERGRAMLASLVQLLAELGIGCVVEGVEVAEQAALLEDLLPLHPGLAAQGFHLEAPSQVFPAPRRAMAHED